MNKLYLLVDYINPQRNIAFTKRLDKISYNIDQVEPLKTNIRESKLTKKTAFTSMTVLGRWIVIYQANIENDDNTVLYFLDFRIDIEDIEANEIFSGNTIQAIRKIQDQYDKVFNDTLDTVELEFAEPFEKVIVSNLFLCENDDIVLNKANHLGVLPIIEALKVGYKVKVAIADEHMNVDGVPILNVYAIIHFAGHSAERKYENGFAYLKLYDLANNLNKIDDFQKAIELAGGKFDRAFFMEKFTKEKLN